MPLRKLDKARKTALAGDRSLPAPAAEGWEAAGGGNCGENAPPPGALASGRQDGNDDDGDDDTTSDSRLLPSRSGALPAPNSGGDVVTARDSSLPGRAMGDFAQQEAEAEEGAGEEEQKAMEPGEMGEVALKEPLLVSGAPISS